MEFGWIFCNKDARSRADDVHGSLGRISPARYSCTATYNYEFKNKTRTVQISYALKYLEDQKKSQASASVQPVKLDYVPIPMP